MQQPTLAPATITHMSQQDPSEQTLRAHLLGQIGGPPQTTAPPSNVISPNGATDFASPTTQNIDPAISSNANSAAAQQQQQTQQQPSASQSHPQQSAMPKQQQPMHPQQQQQQQQQQQVQQPPGQQHVMPQHIPPQMQQMPQHPQSPGGVQTLQMGTSMPQGVPMDMHNNQSHSGAEESEQAKPRGGGKRELSTSKRAAQNRAAQRAFRQRKEGYIKKLEEQVRDFATMQESYKQIQSENYQLRDYIISLQSRLIESQGEDAVPPAPAVLVHPPPPLVLVDTSATSGTSGGSGVMHPSGQQVSHPPLQPPPQQLSVQPQPIQLHQAPIGAPTANMGVGHPSISTSPVTQSVLAANPTDLPQPAPGPQKRAHEDTAPSDHSFLQSIAQAADTGGINPSSSSSSSFIASKPVATASTKVTTSPAAKRVKGDKVDMKKEPESNGV